MNMPSLMDRLPHAFLLMCYCFTCVSVYGLEPELTVPQQVSLSSDMSAQQLSISWLGGAATTFDLMILRTELNKTVIYETVSVPVNPMNSRHQWNWTSVEPLECTSLSVQIRSRDGQMTSEWSNTQILQGSDLPSNKKFQMYPQDRVLPVGANITFCCIVEEGKFFGTMYTVNIGIMNTTRLSRRSYAATLVDLHPTGRTGTNILCYDNLKTKLTGAVMFVGYPPLLTDFVCETRDLTSAVCQWNEGRDTHFYARRETFYSVNESPKQKQIGYTVNQWEGNWTLVAVNPLGQYSLTDSAELGHRVRPVAPTNLFVPVNARNATVLWQWEYNSYSSLPLVCQVELNSHGYKTTVCGQWFCRTCILMKITVFKSAVVPSRISGSGETGAQYFPLKTKLLAPRLC
ncbi:leukemia inhibitory factor receptor-like [Sparus aurata]|uniref:leukemia inhibitory factor receptor-like n=1 Tax=Sparus aurata TaxID=8175 RepID=UPI0011C15BFA|nr:leukemia inhibitory factor receptor-like [Sparus aurata]